MHEELLKLSNREQPNRKTGKSSEQQPVEKTLGEGSERREAGGSHTHLLPGPTATTAQTASGQPGQQLESSWTEASSPSPQRKPRGDCSEAALAPHLRVVCPPGPARTRVLEEVLKGDGWGSGTVLWKQQNPVGCWLLPGREAPVQGTVAPALFGS